MDASFWLDLLLDIAFQAALFSAAFVFGCCWHRNWLCAGCERERGMVKGREESSRGGKK